MIPETKCYKRAIPVGPIIRTQPWLMAQPGYAKSKGEKGYDKGKGQKGDVKSKGQEGDVVVIDEHNYGKIFLELREANSIVFHSNVLDLIFWSMKRRS